MVGAGPVGLATVITARICSPRRAIAVDLSLPRRETVARLGDDSAELPGRMIAKLSKGPGADVDIEAAGDPDTFVLCTQVVRSGGHIANIGMHGKPATLYLQVVAQERDDQHRPGRHLIYPLAARLADIRTPSRRPDHHPRFQPRPDGGCLRGPLHGTDTGALKVVLHRR
jgi:alcohol dehydrogenase